MNRIPANFTLAEALPFMDISDEYKAFLSRVDDVLHQLQQDNIKLEKFLEDACYREERLEEEVDELKLEIEQLEKQLKVKQP